MHAQEKDIQNEILGTMDAITEEDFNTTIQKQEIKIFVRDRNNIWEDKDTLKR